MAYTNDQLGKALEDLTIAYNNFKQGFTEAVKEALTDSVIAEIKQDAKDFIASELATQKADLELAISQAKQAIDNYVETGKSDVESFNATKKQELQALIDNATSSLNEAITNAQNSFDEKINLANDALTEKVESAETQINNTANASIDEVNTIKAVAISEIEHLLKNMQADILKQSGALGEIRYFTSKKYTYGFLYANGNSFIPELYPEFYEFWCEHFDNPKKANYLGRDMFGRPKLPDLRGVALRAVDDGANRGGQKLALEYQGDAIRNITGDFQARVHRGNAYSSKAFKDGGRTGRDDGYDGWSDNAMRKFIFDASSVVPTAEDNRIKSYGVYPFIKVI